MWLGCLGFEPEADKDKTEILEAKQQMETWKEVQEAEKFTNQQYLGMLKEVTSLQENNKQKFIKWEKQVGSSLK